MHEMQVAIRAAKSAGDLIRNDFRSRRFQAESKPDSSLQTRTDLESERVIIDIIRSAFPTHRVCAEESGEVSSSDSEYEWLVDPLDGTDNFVLGIDHFSVSITLCKFGQAILGVVYEPISENLYTAEKGHGAFLNGQILKVSATTDVARAVVFVIPDFTTKRQQVTIQLRTAIYQKCRRVLDTWAPALDWCMVASGRADALFLLERQPPRQDIRFLLVEEAGGQITNFESGPVNNATDRFLIASNGTSLHKDLISIASLS